MKQVFEGEMPARNFAQTESKKQNQKLSVFLTRDSGVKYVVCNSIVAASMKGKLLGTYGDDMPARTFQPMPPVVEVKAEQPPIVTAPVLEPVVEAAVAEPEPEQPAAEKPKRARKPKTDE